MLNLSQFTFLVHRSTILQYMRLTGQVTLHLSNNMSTVELCLDIEKALDTTRHSGLNYFARIIIFDKSH
jgi:hypothetical protein